MWTPIEAKRFLSYAEKHDPDMGVLVLLALDSVARLGELLALSWPDVRDGAIRIRRTVGAARLPEDERKLRFDTPKSDRTRTVEIDTATVTALATMRDRQASEPSRT